MGFDYWVISKYCDGPREVWQASDYEACTRKVMHVFSFSDGLGFLCFGTLVRERSC